MRIVNQAVTQADLDGFDGYILEGCTLTGTFDLRLAGAQLLGCTLRDMHLRGGVANHLQLRNCTIDGLVVNGPVRGLEIDGGTVDLLRLEGAIRQARIANIRGGGYLNLYRAQLRGCSFEHTSWDRVALVECTVDACTFTDVTTDDLIDHATAWRSNIGQLDPPTPVQARERRGAWTVLQGHPTHPTTAPARTVPSVVAPRVAVASR